jgi:hypothetical protein
MGGSVMTRITDKDLENVIKYLNIETNSPLESYAKGEDGKYHAQPGNYHLYSAYGAYGLHRMGNESGGTSRILPLMTKRELYDQIHVLRQGIRLGQELAAARR